MMCLLGRTTTEGTGAKADFEFLRRRLVLGLFEKLEQALLSLTPAKTLLGRHLEDFLVATWSRELGAERWSLIRRWNIDKNAITKCIANMLNVIMRDSWLHGPMTAGCVGQ